MRAFDGRWSPIIGDIVHNLHATLDYLVCQLARVNSANADSRCHHTAFPIYPTAESWNKGPITRRVGSIVPEAQAEIERLQPFNRGAKGADPELHPLMQLYRLEQWDKHRMLHGAVGYQNFDFVGLPAGVVTDAVSRLEMTDEPCAVYARLGHANWPTSIDKTKVHVYLKITPDVEFDPEGPAPRQSIRQVLRNSRAYVADTVIPALEPFLR